MDFPPSSKSRFPLQLIVSACCARKIIPGCDGKGSKLLNCQRERSVHAEKIEFRRDCAHKECSGPEQCSKQTHKTAAQILPDRLTMLPGEVGLMALQSPTLFFSPVIGMPPQNFSVLSVFDIKILEESKPRKFMNSHARKTHLNPVVFPRIIALWQSR